jgi:hypothetical protein
MYSWVPAWWHDADAPKGAVTVCPWPDHSNRTNRYPMWNQAAGYRQLLGDIMALLVRDGVDLHQLHREFCKVDE